MKVLEKKSRRKRKRRLSSRGIRGKREKVPSGEVKIAEKKADQGERWRGKKGKKRVIATRALGKHARLGIRKSLHIKTQGSGGTEETVGGSEFQT